MTGTPFTDVFDLFLMQVRDWRLDSMYEYDMAQDPVTDTLGTYLTGFLVLAIEDFSICDQSLAYSTGSFTETLTSKNQTVLSKLMLKYWLTQEVNDITQMRLALQDMDFKHFAESQNLQAKRMHLRETLEELSQVLVDYGLYANDWAAWVNGTFWSGS